MMQFVRKGSQVILNVTSQVACTTPVYPFTWNENNENNASLVREHLSRVYREAIQQARREAYNQGFKDAKAKKRKEDWFNGYLG